MEIEYYPADSMKNVPFSIAVRAGDMLYLSGQIGTDSTGNVVSGGIVPETHQTLQNIRTALEQHGASLDKVIKVTVMMADMTEWTEINKVYVTYFDKHLPARSAFGTTGLALGARLEVECIAVLD